MPEWRVSERQAQAKISLALTSLRGGSQPMSPSDGIVACRDRNVPPSFSQPTGHVALVLNADEYQALNCRDES